jgi:hypothetical protein
MVTRGLLMGFGAARLLPLTPKSINSTPSRNQVDKKKCLQFCVYAVASLIGLCLDLTRPDVKAVLCTPFAGMLPDREQQPIERVK